MDPKHPSRGGLQGLEGLQGLKGGGEGGKISKEGFLGLPPQAPTYQFIQLTSFYHNYYSSKSTKNHLINLFSFLIK